jgi:Arc/MetJ-type ribon-helix-helix transcriptional regulator
MPTKITLSPYAAQIVQARIDRGEFTNAQSAIDAALNDTEVDDEVEQWLNDVVVPTYDTLRAGKMKTYSSEEVRAHLESLMASRGSKTIAA